MRYRLACKEHLLPAAALGGGASKARRRRGSAGVPTHAARTLDPSPASARIREICGSNRFVFLREFGLRPSAARLRWVFRAFGGSGRVSWRAIQTIRVARMTRHGRHPGEAELATRSSTQRTENLRIIGRSCWGRLYPGAPASTLWSLGPRVLPTYLAVCTKSAKNATTARANSPAVTQ